MPQRPEPCILTIFGASGDLTRRKLIPALYDLSRPGPGRPELLPARTAIVGVSRTEMTDDQFRGAMREAIVAQAGRIDDAAWRDFARRLHYHVGDAVGPDLYPSLLERIGRVAQHHGLAGADDSPRRAPNLLFYLSVAPDLYAPIIEQIGAHGLVTEGKRWCSLDPDAMPWQRIIVEKPFGQDLQTAHNLNMALARVFEEDAIFRIDHYLGKELVQNILVLRLANAIFEPLWNRACIDHVQVTAAETLGVGSRAAGFYDSAGALRDMVQSHLLQVLALVAIEPPTHFDAAAIMREKIKLFSAARPVPVAAAHRHAAFGRYGAGPDGPAYVGERGVDASRRTETFAAVRVEFDTWRWAGVPFYLRSGKRLAQKRTEVVVQFARPPIDIFSRLAPDASLPALANRLIINIAPTEGISLDVQGKVPGAGLRVGTAPLALDYQETFGGEPVEAYGPLLLDAMRGDRTLFKHRDEVEAGWRICQPFLDSEELRESIQTYEPGGWGPSAADDLLAREGRAWNNPSPTP